MRRQKKSDVSVQRIPWRDTYARASSVGHMGERAFLLIPGLGVSANYFERLAFQLNEFGPVIALDLPGFGGVPHPHDGRMTVESYAELVGLVIDELGLDDPIVVGHSMGTQIVAELASTRDLTDLVLLSPVVNPAERRKGIALLRFLQSAVHEQPKIALICLYAYLLTGPRWFSRVLPVLMAYRIEDVLPKINASVLVIAGMEDRLCPPEWVQRVADLLPNAQVWKIPEAAHSVMHGNAEDVGKLCVTHARRDQPDDDIVRVTRHQPEDEPNASPDDALKSAAGRVTELVGIATDDDQTLAQGKTMHAEAAESAAREA